MSRNLVVKHNSLINASYRLSLTEQRLILLSIVEARRMGANITPTQRLTVSADIYMKAFNTTRQASYMALKEACNSLFNREYGYTEIRERGVMVVRSRWVSEIAYNEQEASVWLIFAPSIVPYITDLEKHFTSYELEQVADLNSKYAVRLYEITIAWRSQGKTNQISIEQLRERLGILPNEYQRMELFKRKILDCAVKQINAKTDIHLSYDQHKQGRKIVGFTFKFKIKPQKNDPTPPTSQKEAGVIDPFTGLTDEERKVIELKFNEYINYLQDKGELVNDFHRKNISNKAIAEKWGIAEYQQQQAQEQAEKERHAQELAKQQAEVKRQQQKVQKQEAENRAFVEYFESLPQDEQNRIIGEVGNAIAPLFKEYFDEAVANGTAHKDLMYRSFFRQVMEI